MQKFFTEPCNITSNEGKIIGDDVKHIYKVLRLSEGERIILQLWRNWVFMWSSRYNQIWSYCKNNRKVR